MAGDRRGVRATLQALIFVCLLAMTSGLQLHPDYDDPSTYPAQKLWYSAGAVIVIDLGNTNSCVAGYFADMKTRMEYVPGKSPPGPGTLFQHCIPSLVAFTDDGAALVGDAAKNHTLAHPDAAIFGFKRLFGLKRDWRYDEDIVQGVSKHVPYTIGTIDRYGRPGIQVSSKDGATKRLVDVAEIVSMVIGELKRKAEESLGWGIQDAVITVPPHFGQAATAGAMRACKLAGLQVVVDPVLGTVLEPIAAADAHGLRETLREGGAALVLHVGGATAHADVLALADGYFEPVGWYGYLNDDFLGGDDFDQRVVDHFAEIVRAKLGRDVGQDRVALAKLTRACERAKKALSSQDQVHVSVESLFDGVDFDETLSRSEFEELNEDQFRKVIAMVESVAVGAGLEKKMVDEVVLVGGSTMIPKIQSLVRDFFDGKELKITAKPDEAVVAGAAIRVHSPDGAQTWTLFP